MPQLIYILSIGLALGIAVAVLALKHYLISNIFVGLANAIMVIDGLLDKKWTVLFGLLGLIFCLFNIHYTLREQRSSTEASN